MNRSPVMTRLTSNRGLLMSQSPVSPSTTSLLIVWVADPVAVRSPVTSVSVSVLTLNCRV